MTRITQQQLESYLWGAATLLRGTIDAGDYKQFIFPLLFYKRLCDVFEEETMTALRESGGDQDFALFPENHRFQVPADAHWREIRKASRDVGRALQQAMRSIETTNPDKLFGIFGDAQWTNKDRLPDSMLRDLIEHFSSLELTVANLPEDELGQGYEYLIKKFADDSGHTAAEFYTNRTVVHLMTEMLDVQPGESVYDPTCGSGGMLLSCIAHLRRAGKEWRNVKLYGQERNLMTSSIARMNCFLHGIEDFRIERGDTLAEPKLVEGDRLMRFDVVLANPPYSIKQWDRDAFASDPWGRNLYGTPPQGRADYAFQQHILQSLKPKTGRCAVLWPHGVLFRQEEAEMRRKLIEADLIECVLGLGPNLFYNSPMEACVVLCRTQKAKEKRGKILFINAVDEVTRERTQSFLTGEHIRDIVQAYQTDTPRLGFSRLVSLEEIRSEDWNLSIPRYLSSIREQENLAKQTVDNGSLSDAFKAWLGTCETVRHAIALSTNKQKPIRLYGNRGSDNIASKTKGAAPAFKRAVLAAEITAQLCHLPTFGVVKREKIMFLCEKHLGLDEALEHKHLRQAAGPYDPKARRSIDTNFHRLKWFAVRSGNKIDYQPGEKFGGHKIYFERYFQDHKISIQNIIELMRPLDTERCEIVATLYSAWSDLIVEDDALRDERIVNEVLTNWHSSKSRISKERWLKALAWMKQHRLCPEALKDKSAMPHRQKGNSNWATLGIFSRKGWLRMRFGDVVESCNETCDPEKAGVARFIGLEHLEPGSLHVRKWGEVAAGTTFTRRCKPGQVLFGKRRAYLRKVAIAEFEAVVSGDIYVFVSKDDRLLSEFLPFLCLFERFLEHAVGTSAGSLSPRTNWSNLASFEFDLPPLDQQRRISELLLLVNDALEGSKALEKALTQYLSTKIRDFTRNHVIATDEELGVGTLGDLFEERRETGFNDLQTLAVTIAGKVVPRESLERNVVDNTGVKKYLRVYPGDIAYNTMRMWQGSCGVVGEDGIISPAYTVLVPRSGKADAAFWNYVFHTPELLDWFRRYSTGVASDRWRLYYKNFAKIPIWAPSLKLQRDVVEVFRTSEAAISETRANIANLWNVLQAAVSRAF